MSCFCSLHSLAIEYREGMGFGGDGLLLWLRAGFSLAGDAVAMPSTGSRLRATVRGIWCGFACMAVPTVLSPFGTSSSPTSFSQYLRAVASDRAFIATYPEP